MEARDIAATDIIEPHLSITRTIYDVLADHHPIESFPGTLAVIAKWPIR